MADFDVTALPKDRRAAVALTLQKRAQLTWGEISRCDRHGAGTELIPASQIKPPIPAIFADRERFLVFRYDGLLPMVGIRVTDTFHVLWIENDFGDVYAHG